MVYVEQTTGYFTKEKGVCSQGLAGYIHKTQIYPICSQCTLSSAVNPGIN